MPPEAMLYANSDPLTDNEWRIYDVNGDGKFDISDVNEFVARGGIGFINDLDSDGNKDLTDAFALYVKLSVLDRNCDEAVDNNDFTPIDPVELPEPDAAAVWPLVSRIVTEALTTLPADIEDQVLRSLPDSRTMTVTEKAAIYMETGLSALLQLNLEGAQWAYGRAYQTNNRSASALGSLAFTIAVDNKHEEALTLLARARELFRESGATSTTIGWIFARHGQNREALTYYKEAVEFAPKIAKYHLNLGIAYLRIGSNKEACAEFKTAAELDPGDFHATLFGYVVPEVTPPPSKSPIDLKKLKQEDELQIKDFRDGGATEDELPTPWDECSPCEKARKIPELLERRDGKIFEQIAQSYSDELAEKANKVAQAHAPKYKSAKEDIENWWATVQWGKTVGKALERDSEIALGNKLTSMTRQRGREIIGTSSFFMDCAKQQAEIDAQVMSDNEEEKLKDIPGTAINIAQERAENYQIALEEAINECYKDPMLTAAALLEIENSPYGLPTSLVEGVPWGYFPLMLPGLCLSIPGYCDGDPDLPEFDASMFDNTFTLDLILASLEYNTSTGEWEFRVGQGIILGATWSPESGFGVQLGAGVHAAFFGVNYEAGAYLEGNSEGLTAHLEGGASTILGPGLESGIEQNVIQLEPHCTAMEPCPLP